MVFNSTEALKNYILTHSQVAVEKAKERVANIINHFLLQYYREFEPEVYVRTYQLLCSLIKSDVKFTGNGWVAEVYFDVSKLDYSMKSLKDPNTGKIYTYPNKGWSEEKTLSAAMHGSHGGYTSGTAIWDESLNALSPEAYDILKGMLISEGIPIK